MLFPLVISSDMGVATFFCKRTLTCEIGRKDSRPHPLSMPRRMGVAAGNYVYHVRNRASRHDRVFETDKHYLAILKVLEYLDQTKERTQLIR